MKFLGQDVQELQPGQTKIQTHVTNINRTPRSRVIDSYN